MENSVKSDWTKLSLKNWRFRDQLLTWALTKHFTSWSTNSEESRSVLRCLYDKRSRESDITVLQRKSEAGHFFIKINPYKFDVQTLPTVKMTQKPLMCGIKRFSETKQAPIRRVGVISCTCLSWPTCSAVSKWKKNTFANISRDGTILLI